MSLATPSQIRPLPRKLYREAKGEPECGSLVRLAVNPVGEPDAGNPHVRLCVQKKLVCSVGGKPTEAKVRTS
jgi:hypothetical protein